MSQVYINQIFESYFVNILLPRVFNKIFCKGPDSTLSGQILRFCIHFNASLNI